MHLPLILLALMFAIFSRLVPIMADVPLAPWPGENQAAPPTAELRSRLEALEKQVAEGKAPRDAQNLALLRFKLEQARLWLERLDDRYSFYAYGADRSLVTALEQADNVSRATGDVAQTKSSMHER